MAGDNSVPGKMNHKMHEYIKSLSLLCSNEELLGNMKKISSKTILSDIIFPGMLQQ